MPSWLYWVADTDGQNACDQTASLEQPAVSNQETWSSQLCPTGIYGAASYDHPGIMEQPTVYNQQPGADSHAQPVGMEQPGSGWHSMNMYAAPWDMYVSIQQCVYGEAI